jgi:hypothetical protein
MPPPLERTNEARHTRHTCEDPRYTHVRIALYYKEFMKLQLLGGHVLSPSRRHNRHFELTGPILFE